MKTSLPSLRLKLVSCSIAFTYPTEFSRIFSMISVSEVPSNNHILCDIRAIQVTRGLRHCLHGSHTIDNAFIVFVLSWFKCQDRNQISIIIIIHCTHTFKGCVVIHPDKKVSKSYFVAGISLGMQAQGYNG